MTAIEMLVRRLYLGAPLAACAGLCSVLSAQTTVADDPDAEIVNLSPFTISASSDVGYQATQTLSGSRLKTDLKNVGASVDVLTQEFLDDVMAVDMYDALDYVGNVNTWSKSGSDTEESNQEWWGVPYYARGFLSNTVLTDFFARVEYSSDSYSTENFTVSRGPNAVLYGIGQPGGVVNVSRKRPVLGSDFARAKLLFNSDGGYRLSGDVNQSWMAGDLGVRVAAVTGDKKGFRKGDYDEREGLYGALSYRPFAGTTITATFEDATHDRAIGSNNVFYDAVTPWLQAGRPIYDAQSSDPVPAGIRKTGVQRGSPTYIQGRPDLGVMDWSNAYIGNYFPLSQRTSFNRDTAIFDLTNLITGSDSNVETGYQDLALFVEQKLADNMYLELAYNNVVIDNEVNRLSRVHDYIVVDVNKYLPDGVTPNPYVGVPYLDLQRSEMTGTSREYDSLRATYSWALDLSDRKLGRYNLMGMFEHVEEEYERVLYRLHNGSPLPGANARPQHASNRVRQRVYLNSSITPAGVEAYDMFQWNEAELEAALPAAEWGSVNTNHDWGDRNSWVIALQGDLFESEKGFDYLSFTYGLRHDDNEVWSATGFARDSATNYMQGPVFDTKPSISTPGFYDVANAYTGEGAPTVLDDYTGSYAVMVRPNSRLTFYYNYSDVLIAGTATEIDINFNPTPPTVGETEDFGVRFDLLQDRLYGSLTYFTTTAKNQAINDFHVDHSDVIRAIYEVVDPNSPYYNNLPQWYSLRDDQTKGLEFALTGAIGNTTGRLAISNQDTVISSQLPIFTAWVEANRAAWEAHRNEALLTTPDGLSTVGEAINFIDTEVGNYHALEGSAPGTQRKWKVTATAMHRFTEGLFKRWGLGGTVYWESADTIGYATDPATGLDDPDRGFRGDELFRIDAFVSYKTRLFERNDLTLRLHVRNLLNDAGYYGREAIDDGTGHPYRTRLQLREPRTISFSADLTF